MITAFNKFLYSDHEKCPVSFPIFRFTSMCDRLITIATGERVCGGEHGLYNGVGCSVEAFHAYEYLHSYNGC